MDPVKSTKRNEKEGAKGYEDQDARIQGLEKRIITMTAVIHKVMDERIARFDRIFKEMTDHKDGTNLMLQYFERAATLESEKAK